MNDFIVVYRAATWMILLGMAVMDYKTKTVPSILTIAPTVFSILIIDQVLSAGGTIGFYWFWMIIASGIIGISMYLTKAWSPADSLTVFTASMTLFAIEGGIFNIICLVGYLAYAINVHRTGKFTTTTIDNGKQITVQKSFPFMVIIAIAYPIATFLG